MLRLAVCLVLVAAVSARRSSGCGSAPPSNGRTSFTNQRLSREYWLHVPNGYNRNTETPLVVMFHGWGYSGAEWTNGQGWGAQSMAPTANQNNFIIVAPTGMSDSRFRGNCDQGAGYCGWNGGGTTGSPGPEGATCTSNQRQDLCYRDTCSDGCRDICSWGPCVDDTTMVHALIDRLEEELCIDTTRIYVGGESNGAMMTWQMGTDSRAGRFAAMAPAIGLPHHGFHFLPAITPMPIMGIWGSNDRTIPPGGNDKTGFSESSDGWLYTTGRQITSDWAGAHGCGTNGQPSRYSTSHDGESGLSCTSFCSGNDAPVVDCRFNGGHTVERFMPSLMWEFFSKHVNEHVLGSNATTASA